MNEIQERQQALADQLKEQGLITTPPIEQAFLAVPRHLFLPGESLDRVYRDCSVIIRRGDEGQPTSSTYNRDNASLRSGPGPALTPP